MTRKGEYDRVVSRYGGTANRELDATASHELLALVYLGLGEPLDPETFSTFFGIQTRLRQRQQDLASMLDAGSISPDRYLASLEFELRQTAEQSHALLGADRYRSIFGDMVLGVDTPGNREMLLRETQ